MKKKFNLFELHKQKIIYNLASLIVDICEGFCTVLCSLTQLIFWLFYTEKSYICNYLINWMLTNLERKICIEKNWIHTEQVYRLVNSNNQSLITARYPTASYKLLSLLWLFGALAFDGNFLSSGVFGVSLVKFLRRVFSMLIPGSSDNSVHCNPRIWANIADTKHCIIIGTLPA